MEAMSRLGTSNRYLCGNPSRSLSRWCYLWWRRWAFVV